MAIPEELEKTPSQLPVSGRRLYSLILNDDVAKRTEWGLVKEHRMEFGSYCLKQVSASRAQFNFRFRSLLIPGILLALGTQLVMATAKEILGDKAILAGIPTGAAILLAGFLLLRIWMTPRVFDLGAGYYWKSRDMPIFENLQNTENFCQLKDIYAIQLLKRKNGKASTRDGWDIRCQLNLVLRDGNRLNAVTHGRKALIQTDAGKLSRLLDVPVWDAIS